MKLLLLLFSLIAICLFPVYKLYAQPQTSCFETLAITKPRPAKLKYQFNDETIKEINIKIKNPKRSRYTGSQAVGDATRNLFTSLVGGSATSSQDIQWMLHGELIPNNKDLTWEINLFCNGEIEKTSTRIKNSDGSKSIEKEKTAVLNWADNAHGIIRELHDTLGHFNIILPSKFSAALKEKSTPFFMERDQRENTAHKRIWGNSSEIFDGNSYAIIGNFKQAPIEIYYNAQVNKSYVLMNGQLILMLQGDNITDYSTNPFSRSPNKEKLYILTDPLSKMDSSDNIRLAMFSQFIFQAISQSSYEY